MAVAGPNNRMTRRVTAIFLDVKVAFCIIYKLTTVSIRAKLDDADSGTDAGCTKAIRLTVETGKNACPQENRVDATELAAVARQIVDRRSEGHQKLTGR